MRRIGSLTRIPVCVRLGIIIGIGGSRGGKPEQLVQAYLDHIAIYEPSYNAFTFLNALALDEARQIDRARKAGRKLGPRAGVPIVIKESMDVAGSPRPPVGRRSVLDLQRHRSPPRPGPWPSGRRARRSDRRGDALEIGCPVPLLHIEGWRTSCWR